MSRMCIDHPSGGVETRVRDAIRANLAVVIRQIFYKTVNRIVGVGALVNILGRTLHGFVRRHVDELALTHIPPSYILIHEYVFALRQPPIRAQILLILVRTIWRYAIRGSIQQDWPVFRLILRDV